MSRFLRTCTMVGAAGLAGLVLLACSPIYGDLEIDWISGEGDVDGESLEVEEGRVMVIRVRPLSAGARGYQEFDVVELESLNPSIVYVEGARPVDQFIVGGVAAGDARILVEVNGRDEDEIVVSVVPQEGP